MQYICPLNSFSHFQIGLIMSLLLMRGTKVLFLGIFYLMHSLPGVNGLPERTDETLVDSTAMSPAFRTTHDVCHWLYRRWNAGAVPLNVLSQATTIYKKNLLRFDCTDNRFPFVFDAAVAADRYERKSSGPWYLQCDEGTEVPSIQIISTKVEYIKRSQGPARKFGLCMPKSEAASGSQQKAKVSQTAEVKSGDLACLNVEAAAHFSQVSAWTEQVGGVTGAETWELPDGRTSWMSLTELGTSNTVRSTTESYIALAADQAGNTLKAKTYRACTQQKIGQGNSILHIAIAL